MSPCRENHGSLSPLRHQLLSITLHCCRRLHFNTCHYISIPCIAATTFQYFTSHLNIFHWKALHAAQPPVNYIPLHCCQHTALQCIYSALRSIHWYISLQCCWSTTLCHIELCIWYCVLSHAEHTI